MRRGPQLSICRVVLEGPGASQQEPYGTDSWGAVCTLCLQWELTVRFLNLSGQELAWPALSHRCSWGLFDLALVCYLLTCLRALAQPGVFGGQMFSPHLQHEGS